MIAIRHLRSRALLLLAALLAPSACGGDDPLGPDPALEFLVGDWDATRFVVQSKANPEVAPDLIADLGAEFSVNVQPSGQYTAILVYQGTPFTEIGKLFVDGDEIVFEVSIPGRRTNRSRYTHSAGMLSLVGDTEFDFNLDGTPEEAVATIDLFRR